MYYPLVGEWFFNVFRERFKFMLMPESEDSDDLRSITQEEYILLFEEQFKFKGYIESLLSTLRNFNMFSLLEMYSRVGELQKPVLVIWGKLDGVVPYSASSNLKQTIPHAKLVVIDPREVELTRSADIWIRPVPGTEPYVLAAVLRLVHEKLLAQSHPVSEIAGYKEFVESIQQVDISHVVELTKVPAMQLEALAECYADRSSPASVLYAFDNIALANQMVCDEFIADLVLLSGQLGQSGSGVFPLRSGANDQGAIDINRGFSVGASTCLLYTSDAADE